MINQDLGVARSIFSRWKKNRTMGMLIFEAGRPPECSFLLIYEIEISQVITSFHHHMSTRQKFRIHRLDSGGLHVGEPCTKH